MSFSEKEYRKEEILMPSHVIATLDGSTNAEAGLPHALFFARETQSILTLLRTSINTSPMTGTRVKSCGQETTWVTWLPVSSRKASAWKHITLRVYPPERLLRPTLRKSLARS